MYSNPVIYCRYILTYAIAFVVSAFACTIPFGILEQLDILSRDQIRTQLG